LLVVPDQPRPDPFILPTRLVGGAGDRPKHHAGEFKWLVAALGQPGDQFSVRQRADLMVDRRVAPLEKTLDLPQIGFRHYLKQAEPEGLSYW